MTRAIHGHTIGAGTCRTCHRRMRWTGEPVVPGIPGRHVDGECNTCYQRRHRRGIFTAPSETLDMGTAAMTTDELRDWMNRMAADRRARNIDPAGTLLASDDITVWADPWGLAS